MELNSDDCHTYFGHLSRGAVTRDAKRKTSNVECGLTRDTPYVSRFTPIGRGTLYLDMENVRHVEHKHRGAAHFDFDDG